MPLPHERPASPLVCFSVALSLFLLCARSAHAQSQGNPTDQIFVANVIKLPLEGQGYVNVTAGDLDGDGFDDLVLGRDGTLASMLSNGSGHFQSAWARPLPNGTTSAPLLALGDLDADGDLDVVATLSYEVAVLLGDGRGGFGSANVYPVGSNAQTPVILDFDGDGRLDVAIPEQGSTPAFGPVGFSLHRGDGAGGLMFFARKSQGKGVLAIRAADFNEDGLPDLAITRYKQKSQGAVENVLYLSAAPSSFQSPVPLPFTSRSLAGDLNGDGHQDLIVNENGLFILPGLGDGTFGPPGSSLGLLRYVDQVRDLDGDGSLDLVTRHGAGGYDLAVVSGTGAGAFGPLGERFAIGGAPGYLAVGNFDADAYADFAVADSSYDELTILLGGPAGIRGVPFRASHTSALFSGISVDAADVDLDGVPDVVTVGASATPTGTLRFGELGGAQGQLTLFDAGLLPTDVALIDLDGAGPPELLVVDYVSNELRVMSFVAGTFALTSTVSLSPSAFGMDLGDLNHDGYVDVVVGHSWFTISVLLGSADGTLRLDGQIAVPNSGHDPVLSDLNHDGNLDLITSGSSLSNFGVAVLLGDGLGGFGPSRVYGSFGSPRSVAVGDFNEDGHADIVGSTPFNRSKILPLLLGDGTGVFEPGEPIAIADDSAKVLASDLNGDRHLDLVSIDWGEDHVHVLKGLGDGTFGFGQPLGAGPDPTEVVVSDLDLDGWKDLVIMSRSVSEVAELLNQTRR